jgi:hypothetical protein
MFAADSGVVDISTITQGRDEGMLLAGVRTVWVHGRLTEEQGGFDYIMLVRHLL